MEHLTADKWALITGTTSGIGKAFAELLARNKFNLVLVSRDKQRMEEVENFLSSTYDIKVQLLVADLCDAKQVQKVQERLEDEKDPISVLVNNAGFGINADFSKSSWKKQAELIQVLVESPMKLSWSAINSMKSRGGGYIINVSSVASFMSGSTYCSAKAWLTVFTESIHKEISEYGIKILATCPGFTRTEFHERCKQDVTGVPSIFWLTPEEVAEDAWRKVQKGKVVTVPGLFYKILALVHIYAPRWVVRIYGKMAKSFLRRGGRNT